jgi:hypothetical protein
LPSVPIALRRPPLDLVVAALVAAAIVAATLRAGSLTRLNEPMAEGRWAVYLLLSAVAIAAATRLRAAPPLLTTAPWTGFVALAAASAAWSTQPRVSLQWVAGLAAVTAPAVALAGVVRLEPRYAERVAQGVAAGGALVAVGGLVLLAVDPGLALYTPGAPDIRHLRGLGGNPNTVPLVLAISLPPTLWLAWSKRGLGRAAAATAWLVGAVTLVASGSRGASLGVAAGMIVLAALLRGPFRARMAIASLAVALLVANAAVQQLREPLPRPAAAMLVADVLKPPTPRAGAPGALGSELGLSVTSRFGSGRLRAWWGALEQAERRPVGGYGFGTESSVFIDRYAQFQGSFVESSYVGLVLQLGVAGAVALAALLVLLGREAVRARASAAPGAAAALAGGAAGGAVIGAVQSYLLFGGSVGAAPFWLCAFALAGLAPRRRRPPVRTTAAAVLLAATALVAVAIVAVRQADSDIRRQQLGIERIRELAGPLDGPRLAAFRVTHSYDCLLYRWRHDPFALELCYDDGYLVEAIDRRGDGPPRFWSLRFDAGDAPQRLDPRTSTRLLERIGAISYSERFAEGYPPRSATADTTPIVIEDWLSLIRRARAGGSGSA